MVDSSCLATSRGAAGERPGPGEQHGHAQASDQAYRNGGFEAARAFVDGLVAGLRMTMLLTGARTLAELRRRPVVLGPTLGRWQRLAGSTTTRRKA